jgi:hypothetical protein
MPGIHDLFYHSNIFPQSTVAQPVYPGEGAFAAVAAMLHGPSSINAPRRAADPP